MCINVHISIYIVFLINFFFNWRIIALQNFVVFCQTSTYLVFNRLFKDGWIHLSWPMWAVALLCQLLKVNQIVKQTKPWGCSLHPFEVMVLFYYSEKWYTKIHMCGFHPVCEMIYVWPFHGTSIDDLQYCEVIKSQTYMTFMKDMIFIKECFQAGLLLVYYLPMDSP